MALSTSLSFNISKYSYKFGFSFPSGLNLPDLLKRFAKARRPFGPFGFLSIPLSFLLLKYFDVSCFIPSKSDCGIKSFNTKCLQGSSEVSVSNILFNT